MKNKYDTVVIGGGYAGLREAIKIQKSGRSCVLVESKPGNNVRFAPFLVAGGTLLPGERVVGCELVPGRVISVRTSKGRTLFANSFVLASGKFLSGGLVAEMDKIYEPIFSLDVKYETDRAKWFVRDDFWAPQPFLHFGVITDGNAHPSVNGKVLNNLTVIGNVLCSD